MRIPMIILAGVHAAMTPASTLHHPDDMRPKAGTRQSGYKRTSAYYRRAWAFRSSTKTACFPEEEPFQRKWVASLASLERIGNSTSSCVRALALRGGDGHGRHDQEPAGDADGRGLQVVGGGAAASHGFLPGGLPRAALHHGSLQSVRGHHVVGAPYQNRARVSQTPPQHQSQGDRHVSVQGARGTSVLHRPFEAEAPSADAIHCGQGGFNWRCVEAGRGVQGRVGVSEEFLPGQQLRNLQLIRKSLFLGRFATISIRF